MTPRQFLMLAERRQEELKRADRRAGGIIAMLYNVNRDVEKDPEGADWWDFFTEWKPRQEKEQTEEEMFALMTMFATQRNEGLSH